MPRLHFLGGGIFGFLALALDLQYSNTKPAGKKAIHGNYPIHPKWGIELS
jgi:hypothetical protein